MRNEIFQGAYLWHEVNIRWIKKKKDYNTVLYPQYVYKV